MNSKQQILAALDTFARQRPGMEFGNYGDISSYRAESRQITKDLNHARELIRYIEWHDSIGADAILEAARSCYSGRLSIEIDDSGAVRIDYCTGQYFPTEYRRAVCAVLSGAVWDWFRRNGADPRAAAKREFSRSVARRYFN